MRSTLKLDIQKRCIEYQNSDQWLNYGSSIDVIYKYNVQDWTCMYDTVSRFVVRCQALCVQTCATQVD